MEGNPLSHAQCRQIVQIRKDAQKAQLEIEQHSDPGPHLDPSGNLRPLIANLFNFLAYAHTKLRADLPQTPYFAPWWSTLYHRHLCHLALLNKVSQDPWDKDIWNYMCWTRRSLIRLCEGVIKETHPKLAVDIVASLIDMPRGVEWDASVSMEQRECFGDSFSQRCTSIFLFFCRLIWNKSGTQFFCFELL